MPVIQSEMDYANISSRAAAKVIDTLILYAVLNVLSVYMLRRAGITEMVDVTDMNNLEALADQIKVMVAVVTRACAICSIIFLAGYVFFIGKFGSTPGKMVFKLRIVRSSGRPVSYGRAVAMFFAEILDQTVGIGYLMACSDPQRRTLRDRLCDTRVVRKS